MLLKCTPPHPSTEDLFMAARGTTVIISAQPQGKFLEGVINDTSKPGTVMEIMTPFYRGGRHLWRHFSRTDGYKALVAVLTEDSLQGKIISDAYVAASRCFLYCPIAGEELNMLFLDVAGTADDWAAGDYATVDSGTGKLQAVAGSDADHMVPFQILVAITDPAADFLAPCIYTGR